MTFAEILGSFAISYFAGQLPAIKRLWQDKSLNGKMNDCFDAAMKKFFVNDQLRKNPPLRYSSLSAFGQYLANNDEYDEEARKFIDVLETEYRADEVCYNYILEMKLENMADDIREIKESLKKQQKPFNELSDNLRGVDRFLAGDYHIVRKETASILDWINSEGIVKPEQRICMVSGEAGCGKTVILADILAELESRGIPVVGLKSDYLFDNNDSDIDKALNLDGGSLIQMIEEQARRGMTVLLIDQVDALSLSLTFKRKPLAEVQRVITKLSFNANVRIILSCREYDYKSERAFYRYNGCHQELIKRLEKEEVDKVLRDFHFSADGLSEEEYRFLQNPMNLSLYCRLGEKSGVKAIQSEVYSAYWQQVLTTHANEKGFDTKSLQGFLERLVGFMIHEQVLSVNYQRMGMGMVNEQGFLLSEGYLAQSSDGSQIQFRHQTLFDYTYSRLFFESGKTVEKDFAGVHQGLFVRSRLKTLLAYIREVAPDQYYENVISILTSGTYRFHLKQLVVTLIGSYSVLLPQEEHLLTEVILPDKKLSEVFARTVYALGPVKKLTRYILQTGGFGHCEWKYAERVLDLMSYIFEQDAKAGLWILDQIDLGSLKEERLGALVRVLNYVPIKNSEVAEAIMKKVAVLDMDDSTIEFHHFYANIAKYQPETVADRIKRYVGAKLSKWDQKNDWKFDVSSDLRDMNEALEKVDSHLSLLTGIDLIGLMAEASRLDLGGFDISISSLYWHFNRMNNPYHFPEVQLDKVLDQVEREIKDGREDTSKVIEQLSEGNIDVYHVIAITGWTANIEKYKETAFRYLYANLKKSNLSSLLNYYQTLLLGNVFMLLTQEQQSQLIDVIRKVEPEWEKGPRPGPIPKEFRDKTPNTARGYTKCKLLGAIPEGYLHDNFKEAWKELSEIKRKGFETTNEAPNKVESHHGWTTVAPSKLEQMSTDDRVRLAEKYGSDIDHDWNRPTRVGLAWTMRDEVNKDPEQAFEVYKKLLDNGKADLYYVSTALGALQESGLSDDKMTELYAKLIHATGDDVNAAQSEVLIDICRSLDYYINSGSIAPKVLMDYVIKIAREAEDVEDKRESDVDYNTGINQVRGSAVDHLVRSVEMEPYSDAIFAVLNEIADNASVATRCAALFQMAVMMKIDKEKTLQLFLHLVHDFDKNLLRLPAHNMNPILYLISYNFDALKDYFEHCISEPSCHKVNIVWLLVATLRKIEGAEELLFRMADASEEGRCALVKETENYYNASCHDLMEKALRHYMTYDEEQLGRIYDQIFEEYEKWPENALTDYLNAFFESPVSKYCNHYVYEFLEKYADKNPHQTLYWLLARYFKKSGNWREFDSMTEVLLAAYNRILVFDKNDKVIEDAMDMLDEFLQSNDSGLIAQVSREIANV